jgi:CRP-like cAMP-binding protein
MAIEKLDYSQWQRPSMSRKTEHLVRKLERFCSLSDDEKRLLEISMGGERHFAPREDLIHERKQTEGVFVIVEGFACRYKILPDGRRQIVGILLPGDMCDLRVFLLKHMDHSICALSPVATTLISADSAVELLDQSARLTRALWWTTAVEDSITREWVVNVGYRSALERVAHLLCEVFWRLEAVGLTRNNQCQLPLTQIELGDTLALSSVHVNRTLMYMRRANLVRLHRGQLELLDRAGLEAAAGFDPNYLHLEGGNTAAFSAEKRVSVRIS